jgi:nucleoside-diphosphate-sugar epimerase
MIGVDRIGEIRRAYFEQHWPIKEIVRSGTNRYQMVGVDDCARAAILAVAADWPGPFNLGSAEPPTTRACSRNYAGAATMAPMTACIGSSGLGATNAPGFRRKLMCR